MLTTLRLGENKQIPLRVTHNDTKFNNVLLNEADEPLCVIDLDTVMPGYVHYDYSDAIRTIATTAKEDEVDLTKVNLDLDLFTAFTKGFLAPLKHCLTETELNSLSGATGLLPFTIGLRFLTDYLDGDNYFKTNYSEHNLVRARNQIQLTRSILSQQQKLDEIIKPLIKEPNAIA